MWKLALGISTILAALSYVALPARPQPPAAGGGRGGRGGGGFTQPEPIDFDDHTGWISMFDGKTLKCLTSPIARATIANYPVPNTFGGLGGRGGPARSDVGAAGEGAVTIEAALRPATNPNPPAFPLGPGRRPPAVIYALSSDGMLHAMYISNGVEPDPPVPFLPANANAEGLVAIEGIAYASTRDCNGAPAGVWSLDLSSKQVASWKPTSGDLAGTAGPAFGSDGTIYAATGVEPTYSS